MKARHHLELAENRLEALPGFIKKDPDLTHEDLNLMLRGVELLVQIAHAYAVLADADSAAWR
jgi:hypothetical protein